MVFDMKGVEHAELSREGFQKATEVLQFYYTGSNPREQLDGKYSQEFREVIKNIILRVKRGIEEEKYADLDAREIEHEGDSNIQNQAARDMRIWLAGKSQNTNINLGTGNIGPCQ